ncbi:hypothetical protein D9601_16800 [Sphingomonas sp. MA1305]|jgi:hypothetical protein|uniref:hypothetical protein n=1 Tax=unclassified Sphingomonas TaxID=196159 RepID=UPI0018DF9446|nr:MULTISPECIES: hypothetical protein [unclassified Sphingomonas]MBI0477014.1 hypothetical protein [Sphingomonas sp. MA1305]MCP4025485.1 hypothetical protein [Sphingomonas sp.]
MLPELERFALDIRNLSAIHDQLDDHEASLLIDQMIGHLRSALERLAERDGMLTGIMPWWRQWRMTPPKG